MDLFRKDVQLGDSIKLYLLAGGPIDGVVIEINDNNVVLEINGVKKRFFSQIIGGWDVVNIDKRPKTSDKEKNKKKGKKNRNNENSKQNSLIHQINSLVGNNDVNSALSLIDSELKKTKDSKIKSSLLSRKAQILSSQRNLQLAIDSYLELITYCESINSPASYLSYLYAEVARLYLSIGNNDHALSAKNKALNLNPNNKIARQLQINSDDIDAHKSEQNAIYGESSLKEIVSVKLTKKKLIEDDVERHQFVDNEIISLNGIINDLIANRLLDESHRSSDITLFLEAAKALKSLPEGSYNTQDYEDTLTSYAILKCRYLYNSATKIIREAGTHNVLIEQIIRLKDCAVSYYLETIERIIYDDIELAKKLLDECLKIEMAVYALDTNKNQDTISDILQSDSVIDYCLNLPEDIIITLVRSICFYSVICDNLWNNLLCKSDYIRAIDNYISKNQQFKTIIINSFKSNKAQKIILEDNSSFLLNIILWECSQVDLQYQRLNSLVRSPFDIFSLNSVFSRCKLLNKGKNEHCFCKTDRQSIKGIHKIISILLLYSSRDDEQRKEIIYNARQDILGMISWNSSTTTSLGRFYFAPLLNKWLEKLDKLTEQKEQNKNCFLELSFDPPYYNIVNGVKRIQIVISNNSKIVSEGYHLSIWPVDNKNNTIVFSSDKDLLPNNTISIEWIISNEKWGEKDIYEMQYALKAKYLHKWTLNLLGEVTITKRKNVSFSSLEIIWHDEGDVPDEMFKGRTEIVEKLTNHYCSVERYYSYVLYGLSRTGKSCILKHLQSSINGKKLLDKNSVEKIICPIYLDLGAIHGASQSKQQFNIILISSCVKEIQEFLKFQKYKNLDLNNISDFNSLVQYINNVGIRPLFMFDEFSFMKSIIDDGYMNTAFLQYMRSITADKDLASFIFAGTYDIKQLIHDERYNISSAFNYLREPQKPIFEISKEAAEELITAMGDLLTFTPLAIQELHRLSGDVPHWIQKLCNNCAYYAIEKNCSDIGLREVNDVVRILTGETFDISDDSDLEKLPSSVFEKTQILSSDPPEVELILTSIAFLIRRDKLDIGVSYKQLLSLWDEYGFDSNPYKIEESIHLLLERRTLSHKEINNIHYYDFSLSLFRKWWYFQDHYDIALELQKFSKKINKL